MNDFPIYPIPADIPRSYMDLAIRCAIATRRTCWITMDRWHAGAGFQVFAEDDQVAAHRYIVGVAYYLGGA